MSIAEEIKKLDELRENGSITQEEYDKAKKSLLAQNESASEKFSKAADSLSKDANMWGMFIHFSLLLGFIVPFAGLIIPIVLWQVKKKDSEVINMHGIIVTNWILTAVIFGVVFTILTYIIIGIPLLLALAVTSIIFAIIGGIKANNGEIWPYPLSIKFFKAE